MKPNYLIIISDCTRPDKMSCYGYERNTTPNVDEVAKEGTVYTNAYTQGVWTLPTHCSLFTGLYPSEHGLLAANEELDIQLDKGIPTLAEQLRELGYVTAGISNNPWVGYLSGMNRGFDFFMESDGTIKDELGLELEIPLTISLTNKIQSVSNSFFFKLLIPYLVKRPLFTQFSVDVARRVVDHANKVGKNFFIFMNLMDTHQPYYPPKEVLSKIAGGYGLGSSVYTNYKIRKYYNGENIEVKNVLNDYYDASLRYQDEQLGGLFSHLRESDKMDDTAIFFTSDHGKNLGEYGVSEQLNFLKDNILRIPLIVRYPERFPAGEDSSYVQLIDINYTIREMMGESKVHEKDNTLLDDGKVAYVEAELPFNIMEEKSSVEKDKVMGVVTKEGKLIESQREGLLYSAKTSLDEEKFSSADSSHRLYELLDGYKRSLSKSGKEKERLSKAIKKMKLS